MSLKVAFQTEPLADIDPKKNNTLTLMAEVGRRGHKTYQYYSEELSMDSDKVYARARMVEVDIDAEDFIKFGADEWLELAGMDVVMARQNPPFDMKYLTSTYILEKIMDKTLVVNNPVSVRENPEKLFPFIIREFAPPSLISSDLKAIEQFVNKHGRVIIKPLYAFGGRGVYDFNEYDEKLVTRAEDIMERFQAPIIIQKLIPEVKDGDKRILLLDGEISGAFIRVPKDGSIRANLAQGGTLTPYEINQRDREICEKLKPVLQEKDIIICGIDIIGDFLTEINITSPMGFREINKLYGKNTESDLWDVIEGRL